MKSNILQFAPRAERVEPTTLEAHDASPASSEANISITGLHSYAINRNERSKTESEIATKLRAVFDDAVEEYPDLVELLEPMLDCKISDTEHGLTPMANLYATFREELMAEANLYYYTDDTA